MKKSWLAGALAAALLCGSCIGPYNAFNSLRDWNDDVSDSKWGREVVHAALYIVPVYQLALLGDIIIFNSIDFWGGDAPFD